MLAGRSPTLETGAANPLDGGQWPARSHSRIVSAAPVPDFETAMLPLLYLPTLTFACCGMLVLSAALLTLYGGTSRVYRGYWWCVGAQALLAIGVAAEPLRESHPLLSPAIQLLWMQWPITVVAGLRRFYGRPEWRAPASADLALLAAAFIGWLLYWVPSTLSGPVPGAGLVTYHVAFAAGTVLVGLYAAWLVVGLTEFRHSLALKAFVATAVIGGVHEALRISTPDGGPADGLPALLRLSTFGLLLTVTSLTTVFLALLLTSERTEANLLVTQRNLRVLADMDVLTGMANRRHFLERASALLEAPDAPRSAVLMFDVDHFKQINDRLGHDVGDEALRQIARCVRDTLRERDLAGRLGGDEFAVLLPDTSLGDAMAVAGRIVALLEHRQVAPRLARLGLSFGVVQTHAGEAVAEALRRADQALYEAKRQGRGRAVAASGNADQPVFNESRPMGLLA